MKDWNLILNAVGLIALAVAAFRVGFVRRSSETITDLERAIAAKDRRIDALEEDVAGLGKRASAAEQRAHECEKAVARWEARYEELKQYTAEPAILHFEELMREHREQVQKRHEAMLTQLAAQASALNSHGELLLKNLEVISKVADKLGVPLNG